MASLWLKFCGIVRPEDHDYAVSLRVDAIGIVAVPGTPRAVSVSEAKVLGARRRESSLLVLVMQDPDPGLARAYIAAANPDLLQLHGEETPAFAESLGVPYIKATRSLATESLEQLSAHRAAWGMLLDSADASTHIIEALAAFPGLRAGRLLLAGQLTTAKLPGRVSELRPFGVDVSRGVEAAPRVKDHRSMLEFVHAVRAIHLD